MTKADTALASYNKGITCSSSVFSAFADELGLDDKTAKKTGCGFCRGDWPACCSSRNDHDPLVSHVRQIKKGTCCRAGVIHCRILIRRWYPRLYPDRYDCCQECEGGTRVSDRMFSEIQLVFDTTKVLICLKVM